MFLLGTEHIVGEGCGSFAEYGSTLLKSGHCTEGEGVPGLPKLLGALFFMDRGNCLIFSTGVL